MSDHAITISDEDIAESKEGFEALTEVLQDARKIVDNPDSYTQDEVVKMLDLISGFFLEVLPAGQAFLEASIEINQLTNIPSEL